MTEPNRGPAWLVLPTYNEAENIEPFVAAVRANLPADARILIVDDGSPDGTGERADRLAERHPNVTRPAPAREGRARPRLHRRVPAGARRRAPGWCWRWTPTSPTIRPTCRGCSTRRGSADLVIGSRYVAGGGVSDWGVVRRAISRGGSVYSRLVLGVEVHDLTGGFKCFRREVLEAIDLDSIEVRGYAFQVEMTYRAIQLGFKVVEVPIVFRDRGPASRRWTARSSSRPSSSSPACASAPTTWSGPSARLEEPTVEEA